ncbi:rod-binding protein [Fodinicurvata sp. EGI_FJ10296]|uniref:rod-binding protein n=1 Tax=Fodinicurvata sp. EGI_FJ10296 TaxID=3231908 RepID=UPI003456DC99
MDAITATQQNALSAYGGQRIDATASAVSRSSGSNATDAATLESAKEFEAVFLSQMLTHMWTDVSSDGLFGGGHGEEMTRSLLVDEYAQAMVDAGGIGIADQVRAEMLRLQEGSSR